MVFLMWNCENKLEKYEDGGWHGTLCEPKNVIKSQSVMEKVVNLYRINLFFINGFLVI